jgi:hypothetical protein
VGVVGAVHSFPSWTGAQTRRLRGSLDRPGEQSTPRRAKAHCSVRPGETLDAGGAMTERSRLLVLDLLESFARERDVNVSTRASARRRGMDMHVE